MSSKGKSRQGVGMGGLFPCASGVTMPQLGVEDAQIRKHLRIPASDPLDFKPASEDSTPVAKQYLKKISADIKFAEDVVKERCFFALPYDPKYLEEAFDISDFITERPKAKDVGRHNATGSDLRHKICGLKVTKPPHSLKPLKKKLALRALEMSDKAKDTPESSQSSETSLIDTKPGTEKEESVLESQPAFMTEAPYTDTILLTLQEKIKILKDQALAEAEDARRPKSARARGDEKAKKDWDHFLMSKLSQGTATWIVHERTSPTGMQHDELRKTLHTWYGKPTHTDLVREDVSDDDDKKDPFDKKQKKPKPPKTWKKEEETLLEQVYQTPTMKALALDPYSDDNKAPFYRQPAGIRKQKKHDMKEEAGRGKRVQGNATKKETINATAHRIKVKRTTSHRPPTLRDFMPPGVGNTLYDTQNQYVQEMLTGVEQIPSADDKSLIIMASQHKYKKQLRCDYPDAPQKWYPSTEEEKEKSKHVPIISERGSKRWKGLPQPYDDTFEAQKVVPPGFQPEFSRAGDPAAKRRAKQNSTLMQILHDWRAKWNLSSQYADATYEDIIRDMADIQPHVRLKAIATIGKAAEYKPPSDPGIQFDKDVQSGNPVAEIPEHVYVALDCLLGDSNGDVRRAAAITLYALEHPTDKAREILRQALTAEAAVERWAAAQCLAHFGVCDSRVVDEIIKQILASEEPIKHEQGIALLAKISNNTTLVHCMVAEQLNSSSWRHRVIACKILPALYGTINKDVTHKLTELMWHDWHTEVRRAAAQCLGKTSHGRDVHDDLRRCIMYGSERVKLEAISRLGQLGIMTAKLLPAFLACFSDEYVSIRSECCITSGNLEIKEESVIEKLVNLATYDSIWKVKALAIQALGKIGVQTGPIKECLLWAMRYEEKAGVRAEACHSLAQLQIMDEDVVQIIRERLLVESSQIVKDEMIEMLQVVGLNATEDMDMVTQIKDEVRKLCHRDIIASQIVLDEADEMRQQNLQNMIYMSEAEVQRRFPKRNFYLHLYSARQHTDMYNMQRKLSFKRLKEEERKESAQKTIERLKVISQMNVETAASPTVSCTTTTPEPISREATMFTPSADKELEAILSRDDAHSGESSTKSRPVTGETDATSGTYPSPGTSGEEEEEDTKGKQSAAELIISLTPGKSRLGLTPSASLIDNFGDRTPSVSAFPSQTNVSSREHTLERAKLNEHVNRTYDELNTRYLSLDNELYRIDCGLMLGASSLKFLAPPGQPAEVAYRGEVSSHINEENPMTDSSCSSQPLLEFAAPSSPEDKDTNENQAEAGTDRKEEDSQLAVSLEVPGQYIQSDDQASDSFSDQVGPLVFDKEDQDDTKRSRTSTMYSVVEGGSSTYRSGGGASEDSTLD